MKLSHVFETAALYNAAVLGQFRVVVAGRTTATTSGAFTGTTTDKPMLFVGSRCWAIPFDEIELYTGDLNE